MWLTRSFSRSIQCATAIALASACGGGGDGGDGGMTNPPPPPPSSVVISTPSAPPPRFVPASVTLAAGGKVTWKSDSPVEHNIVSTTSNWQLSQSLGPGATFQTTIAQPGTYRYQCTIPGHEGMTGSIEVK